MTNPKSMLLSLDEYQRVLRYDFMPFLERSFYTLNPQTPFHPNWHLEALATKLEACPHGQCRRLIVTVPPRSLKSISISIAYSAWLLGQNPAVQIINVSYGQELADKLARDTRTLMLSEWYQAVFSTRLSAHRQAAQDFMTTAQGGRLATSVGGVLTGRGGEYLLIDDPLKPDEALSDIQRHAVNEWYDHTLSSRLNHKDTGVIILVMQRLHLDDLVGHVLAQEPWEVLSFPAIAEQEESFLIESPFGTRHHTRHVGDLLHPTRESAATLARLRQTMGEYHFAGQYQQTPVPLGGGLVKREWLRIYDAERQTGPYDHIIQSWDTANKSTELSDYSVCTTWGIKGRQSYLLHVLRKRLNYPDLKRSVREQADLHQATVVLIEDKASGTQLIQELVYEGLSIVKGVQPAGDKFMRLHAQTAVIENGFVWIPDTAPWLADYVQELTTFPKAKYDDQADSTAQALQWIQTSQRRDLFECDWGTDY